MYVFIQPLHHEQNVTHGQFFDTVQLFWNLFFFLLLNRHEAWWFLSLGVFGLLSSSLLLFPQHFGWYVLRPSSGVCQTRVTFTELRTTSFIESMGVAFSDSVSHNQVQLLSIPVLLLGYSQDWTCNLQMKVPKFNKHLKKARGHQLKHCGNNNKDEDNSPKTLNDKNPKVFNLVLLYNGKYHFISRGLMILILL